MPLNFLFPPHTHTVLTHYMPLKSDEEGTDCGHIYKRTRLNSSLCFSFRQIYDGLCSIFGLVNILLGTIILILSGPDKVF